MSTPLIIRPMKAQKIHEESMLEELEFPVMISAKLDGIRCLLHPVLGPVTQSFIPVPNIHVRELLWARFPKCYLDGELVATDADGNDLTYNETQSAIMSRGGAPHFRFYVFDTFHNPEEPFHIRFNRAVQIARKAGIATKKNTQILRYVNHPVVCDTVELLDMYEQFLENGYEGICVRAPDGPYKSGRSTFRQGWLLKYKPISSAEGTVTGFQELMRNRNPDERDKFGLAKRSSHKANLKAASTLGALIIDTQWGEISIGSGFDMASRDLIWNDTGEYLGKTVTFTYQLQGMKELPRFPIFKGFRHD